MNKFHIDNILKINEFTNEFELEKAGKLQLKLRWMAKEDPSLVEKRNHLRKLIKQYEEKNWNDIDQISDEQIIESDNAELITDYETQFVSLRKEIILRKLSGVGLSQQDFGNILNHSKSYMSELINGLRPFSKQDIVIIHRLLKIPFDQLILVTVKDEVAAHIKETLVVLNKSNPALKKVDFELELA